MLHYTTKAFSEISWTLRTKTNGARVSRPHCLIVCKSRKAVRDLYRLFDIGLAQSQYVVKVKMTGIGFLKCTIAE